MPLHISVDVDGTLLDENGNLVDKTRKSLEELKTAEISLQLWSTSGADYAKAKAKEHNLSDMFDSYATKPDLAVDDEPENVHPIATVAVSRDFSLAKACEEIRGVLAECADAALSPPCKAIVQLVESLQGEDPRQNPQFTGLFRNGRPFYPIPFFGPLEMARVITVGLNPSSDEFAPWRSWDDPRWKQELAWRLHNYFRLVCPRPHSWFAPLQEALYILSCPYKLAAAHVDLSPWASYGPRYLRMTNPNLLLPRYNELLDSGIVTLRATLRLVRNPKLVLIYRCGDRASATKEVIQSFWPIESGPRIEILPFDRSPADWVNEHRDEFREWVGFKNIFE